jgi:hypothetical protein
MEVQQDALADAYAFHYEQLQEQVLDAATICCQCLDDAGVRLLEGGLLEAYAREGECTFASSFEALQDLYAKGQLKALVLWFISPHTYGLGHAARRSNGSDAELSLLSSLARSRRVNVHAKGRAMAW